MQVEGVPEGWELVAIRKPKADEWILGGDGLPFVCPNYPKIPMNMIQPIIRKVAPVCTWPQGVFCDGWIAEDNGGEICWYASKPEPEELDGDSDYEDAEWFLKNGEAKLVRECQNLLNAPVFRADLPWDQRIQQVGPTIESKLKGGA